MTGNYFLVDKPVAALPVIVRVLKSDQRAVLLKKLKSLHHCECGGEYKFGFVYFAGSKNVVNGISVECQQCFEAFTCVFDPPDSLQLVRKDFPKEVIGDGVEVPGDG